MRRKHHSSIDNFAFHLLVVSPYGISESTSLSSFTIIFKINGGHEGDK